MRPALRAFVLLSLALLVFPALAFGFGEIAGACESDCSKCHQVSLEEAARIVKDLNPEVRALSVKRAAVPGFWEVVVEARGKKGIAYLDFSKQYLISGQVINVKSRRNVTEKRLYEVNKLDVAAIPLEGALLLGSPDASHKAVIFSDPDCPYCRKLHQEMKKVVQEREDIAFYIKLRPLDSHPESYQKSKSIVCEGSLRLLERAYDGRSIPAPACKSTVVDETIALADKLGITGTPTIVLPDGGVVSGYRDAPQLEALIDGAVLALKQKEEEAKRAEEEAERKAAEEARRARERPAQTPQQPAAASEMKSPSGAASEGEVSTAPGAPLTEERVTSEEMKPPEAGATAPAEAAEKPKPERKRRWHWPWE
jgi:thiol:disulfide interchange protein DsbC